APAGCMPADWPTISSAEAGSRSLTWKAISFPTAKAPPAKVGKLPVDFVISAVKLAVVPLTCTQSTFDTMSDPAQVGLEHEDGNPKLPVPPAPGWSLPGVRAASSGVWALMAKFS